jgi:hypothetical protein
MYGFQRKNVQRYVPYIQSLFFTNFRHILLLPVDFKEPFKHLMFKIFKHCKMLVGYAIVIAFPQQLP